MLHYTHSDNRTEYEPKRNVLARSFPVPRARTQQGGTKGQPASVIDSNTHPTVPFSQGLYRKFQDISPPQIMI